MLYCINSVLKPNKGSILIDGKNIASMTRNDIAKQVGLLPQEHRATFPYSVLDVVIMGRAPHIEIFSSPKNEDVDIATKAVETIGITHLIDKPFINLSGGEMQLVLIARALAQEPDIILLDEPTSHLDFKNQILVLKIIKMLSIQKKITIIMTLHDPNQALMFSDKVVMMNKERIVAIGPPNETVTKNNIKAVYQVDVQVVTLNQKMKMIFPETEDGITQLN